jgi:hypothetical protein
VEYPVTGHDPRLEAARNSSFDETRELVRVVETLDENGREFMLAFARLLKKMLARQNK